MFQTSVSNLFPTSCSTCFHCVSNIFSIFVSKHKFKIHVQFVSTRFSIFVSILFSKTTSILFRVSSICFKTMFKCCSCLFSTNFRNRLWARRKHLRVSLAQAGAKPLRTPAQGSWSVAPAQVPGAVCTAFGNLALETATWSRSQWPWTSNIVESHVGGYNCFMMLWWFLFVIKRYLCEYQPPWSYPDTIGE